jgi:hypothetical protein
MKGKTFPRTVSMKKIALIPNDGRPKTYLLNLDGQPQTWSGQAEAEHQIRRLAYKGPSTN